MIFNRFDRRRKERVSGRYPTKKIRVPKPAAWAQLGPYPMSRANDVYTEVQYDLIFNRFDRGGKERASGRRPTKKMRVPRPVARA